ncbi:MAG: hypothetical protein ACLFVB_03465 [Thermoplasmata archaeon]
MKISSDPLVWGKANNPHKRRKIPKIKLIQIKEELLDIARNHKPDLIFEPEMEYKVGAVGIGPNQYREIRFHLEGLSYPFAKLKEIFDIPFEIQDIGIAGKLIFQEEEYPPSWYEIGEVVVTDLSRSEFDE